MENNPTTERTGTIQPQQEPRILTEDEKVQIAAGLVSAVNGVTGRCCCTCGISVLGSYAL